MPALIPSVRASARYKQQQGWEIWNQNGGVEGSLHVTKHSVQDKFKAVSFHKSMQQNNLRIVSKFRKTAKQRPFSENAHFENSFVLGLF